MLKPGDVLLSIVGTIGKVALVPPELDGANITQSSVRIRPGSRVTSDFIRACLQAPLLRAQFDARRLGTGVPRLNVSDVRELKIPVPPAREQRRVVAKLDALQSKSRRAKDAVDAIPPLLERFRQSVLAAAFRGDLTADWRVKHPDVEPASELLKRIRVERRRCWEEAELAKMQARGKAPKDDRWKADYCQAEPVAVSGLSELPGSWATVELGEVVTRLTNGYVGPTRDIYVDRGVPYLLSKHVRRNTLRFDEATFITEEFNAKNKKSKLRTGDVLLVQTGHVGESAVVPPAHEGHNCHAMIVITPLPSVLDGSYLSLFFGCPQTQAAFGAIEKGMTLRHLNCHDVIRLPTSVPPLPEQRRIVEVLMPVLRWIDKVAGEMAEQVVALGGLDRAILAKAFRGELVPQDPSDEPASALLQRLQPEDAPPTTAPANGHSKTKPRTAATKTRKP
jgi:type I restriction enzyme S subunit